MWLGIETSSLVSGVAVMDEYKVLGEITVQAGFTHSEQLVPHVDALFRMTGVQPADLKGIAVSTGPGSFTGLRIGMGTAKAMAYALGIPLYGVMTMDGLARNIPYTDDIICTVVDAQKKHVYAALYTYKNDKPECIETPFVTEAAQLMERLQQIGRKIIFVGDGIPRIAKLLTEDNSHLAIAEFVYACAKASSLLWAAKPLIDGGKTSDPMDMVPFYIRRSEAEVLWEEKHKDSVAINGEPPSVIVTETAERDV